MGIIVENYTTPDGFLVPQLYISVNCFRFLKSLNNVTFGAVYFTLAYKSQEDKHSGKSPISIPNYLANVEELLAPNDFYDMNIFGFAYRTIKKKWESAGYSVLDVYEPGQPTPTTYIYDASGYSFRGYNPSGYDRDGYDKNGFNASGWDRDGYDRNGYNAEGYNRQGFNAAGYDRDGYDRYGFNASGWDRDGYDRNGFNAEGYDRNGYNAAGYDRDGYDRDGYDVNGLDRNGNTRPVPTEETVVSDTIGQV